MHLFNRVADTIFLKEESQATEQLDELKEIRNTLNATGQKILNRDIKLLKYGIAGEKNIAFELKNSHLLMYVIKDLFLEFDGLSAQIDYMVFTKKHCYLIECKNLYGNIQVNENDEFQRILTYNGRTRKEGMYSPMTQIQRHLDLIKRIVVKRKRSFFMKFAAERYFTDYYKPIIVLANPKTIVDTKEASHVVQEKVIRADQLIQYIKETEKHSSALPSSEKQVASQAQFFFNLHSNSKRDYLKKYDAYKVDKQPAISDEEASEQIEELSIEEVPIVEIPLIEKTHEIDPEFARLYNVLKQYRLLKSQDDKIKPYYIFTNAQLDQLVAKMPRTKRELKTVEGFGQVRVEKYGDDLIQIIKKYIDYINH